jgi:hypothetical protein
MFLLLLREARIGRASGVEFHRTRAGVGRSGLSGHLRREGWLGRSNGLELRRNVHELVSSVRLGLVLGLLGASRGTVVLEVVDAHGHWNETLERGWVVCLDEFILDRVLEAIEELANERGIVPGEAACETLELGGISGSRTGLSELAELVRLVAELVGVAKNLGDLVGEEREVAHPWRVVGLAIVWLNIGESSTLKERGRVQNLGLVSREVVRAGLEGDADLEEELGQLGSVLAVEGLWLLALRTAGTRGRDLVHTSLEVMDDFVERDKISVGNLGWGVGVDHVSSRDAEEVRTNCKGSGGTKALARGRLANCSGVRAGEEQQG